VSIFVDSFSSKKQFIFHLSQITLKIQNENVQK